MAVRDRHAQLAYSRLRPRQSRVRRRHRPQRFPGTHCRNRAHSEHRCSGASMTSNWAAIFYLASGVLFILALRGLSSPETSRQGNTFGMIGMAIAIATTLLMVRP